MRMILSLVCAVALVGFVGADDKGKEVKLEGKMCCAKCELNKSDKCATVFVAKDGEKETIYYLDSASNKKFPHKDYCQGSTDAKVTGTVSEKDGKKMITISKLEKKE
jgi:hypothetical protein